MFSTTTAESCEPSFPQEACLELEALRSSNEALRGMLAEHLEEAHQAYLSAIEAGLAKGRFLQDISNELRTPLNGILGMLRLALKSGLDTSVAGFVVSAVSAADELMGVLDDISDMAKLEAGSLDLEVSAVSLRAMLDAVFERFEPMALRKGVSLLRDFDDDLPDIIEADGKRLCQVLKNLVSNAVKFTDQGKVTIEVKVACATESMAELLFAVRDTGPGIEPRRKEELFRPFEHGSLEVLARPAGGSGLGLAISLRLVEMMGGYLDLDSVLGEGSCFHFTLACVRYPDEAEAYGGEQVQPVDAAPALSFGSNLRLTKNLDLNAQTWVQLPPRILLVEHDDVNRDYESALLTGAGCEVVTASDGPSALEILKEQQFDAVLLELQIPHLDGIEVTRQVRAAERALGAQPTPLIALTSRVMECDRARCFAAGVDAYLTKPVDEAMLLESLRRAIPMAALSQPEDTDAGAGLSVDELLRKLGSTENFNLMAGLFSRRWPEQLKELGLAREARDRVAMQRGIQDLRGVFLSMGAPRLQARLRELEYCLGRSHWDAMEGRLTNLKSDCEAMERLMGSYVFASKEPKGRTASLPDEDQASVLLVDDDAGVRFVTAAILRRYGHQVVEAESGAAALELLAQRDIDVVLLDVVMPDLDGYEVCRIIKSQLRTRKIPVLLLSGMEGKNARITGIEVGADDFLNKPVDAKEMAFRVRNACRLKRMLDRLEQSFESLKKTEALRDELAHMLVHDMRSPLSGVMGYAGLLLQREKETLTPRGARYAKQIESLSRMLNEMVSSILDVSRLEAGELPLALAPTDLVSLAQTECERFQGLPGASLEVVAEGPVTANCDAALVTRVIGNLVTNALNYSSDGHLVRVRILACQEMARIEVIDQGPGVPDNLKNKIFEKFVQVEDAKGRRPYSSGLGLTFCRLVSERHGGLIGVESELGRGSTFWFTVPLFRTGTERQSD